MSSIDNKNTKNRTDHITELIKALPLVKGFPFSEDEMWVYFNLAVKDKDISIRKLSAKKEKSDNPKRITGYNLFTKTYNSDAPDGSKTTMSQKAAIWKELSEEEKNKFNTDATKENTSNGIQSVKKTESLTSRQEKWAIAMKEWYEQKEQGLAVSPLPPPQPRKTNSSKSLEVLAEPVEPIEQVEPVEQVEPIEHTEPIEQVEPIEHVE